MFTAAIDRTPGSKLMLAILIAGLLAVPLFATYLLVFDRESQSQTARASIVQGWGGGQRIAPPVLVIPYAIGATVKDAAGQSRIATVWHELTLTPDVADLATRLAPEERKRSIYAAVVYQAVIDGTARFALPDDLARLGVTRDALALDRAELRFGVSDASGLAGAPPVIRADGVRLALQPGSGSSGDGFHAWLDAGRLATQPLTVRFAYALRGSQSLALAPGGGDTRWTLTSSWPSPSFAGSFLPTRSRVGGQGFAASWRIGNLALGRALASTETASADSSEVAQVDLVTPVDLYSEVDRSVKYGFLFIGFTFLMFWMFDVIGGVAVATVEYLLAGAGLVLFFIMLLAFAEVIGFPAAYVVAAGAIVGLLSAYSAAVLASWRRATIVAALLAGLYGALYVLLSLEAYSLLIGSVLLFLALAAVMWLTRRLDWYPPAA
ncbi:MAG: cell envelope integrity protein CreD [Sphingomonas sp.]